MSGLIERSLELGLGALALTKEKAQELVDELVKLKAVPKERGKELLERMLERGREARDQLEQVVQRQVKEALQKAKLVTRSEYEALLQRIAALEEKLAAAEAEEE
ncbi:MAG TPA: polyhydroxyalkanoate synthesis regulator [Armatimonadetes bacterium]|nr:polyhydroxyalkanoate synthesis regulator [Armatimonadota bacterium]